MAATTAVHEFISRDGVFVSLSWTFSKSGPGHTTADAPETGLWPA